MPKLPIAKALGQFFNRYPVVFAAIAIYGYYLTTTVDFFKKSHESDFTLLDFVVQFDSLIWMWVTALVFVKFQQVKEKRLIEQQSKLVLQAHLEKSAVANAILQEITTHLQDAINNPLAIIRLTTEDVRRRCESDPDILRGMEQIDSSSRRIHNAIKDVTMYESTRILEMLAEATDIRADKGKKNREDHEVLDA